MKEKKKSYSDRASTEDLTRYLERIGEKREIIRMAVTISASQHTRKDYEGILKGTLQIPLRNFHSDPQANVSEEPSWSCGWNSVWEAKELQHQEERAGILQQAKMHNLSTSLLTKAQREHIYKASQVRKVTKRLITTKGKVPETRNQKQQQKA